ncbi:MAG: polymer-forming cytoskeletal protein [Gammaproteobacteria bacterium]
MWGKRSKRWDDPHTDTLIGPRSQIRGDVLFSGVLHVEGTVKGNVIAEGSDDSALRLVQAGTIEGEVRVPNIFLNGVVNGDVHALKHIELGANARVEGDVYYSLIEMAMGAEVNGKLVHLSERDRTPLQLQHRHEPEQESGQNS